MTNLGERVKKAKKLVWSHNHYSPNHYGTWGSGGDKYYHIDLSHSKDIISTPDGSKIVTSFEVECKQNVGYLRDCPGNIHHTVCYHGIGALYESFRKSDKLISFFETYENALQRKFDGKIVIVKSNQGNGFLWAVIKEWPKKELTMVLPVDKNINLMRGSEDDEGID